MNRLSASSGPALRRRGISAIVVRHGIAAAFGVTWLVAALCFEFSAQRPFSTISGVLESVYSGLRLFVLEYSLPKNASYDIWTKTGVLNSALLALAYVAAGISFSAILLVLARAGAEWARLFWQSRLFQSRRAVLLGFGTVNRAIALALKRRRYAITAIDERFDDADQLMARENGVLLVAGDLTDARTLQRANLAKATLVSVSAGNDIANIEIAAAARRTCQRDRTEIYAHVGSPGFADDLRESRDLGFPLARDIRTFSAKRESALNLLRWAQPARRAKEHGHRRAHLVIVGMGDQGESILLESLLDGMATDLLPPKVTVLDREATIVGERFKARRPRLFDGSLPKEAQPIIEFHAADIGAIDFETDAFIQGIDDSADLATVFVFCCGEDETNLIAGLRLEQAMSRNRRAPALIYITVWGAGLDRGQRVTGDPLGFSRIFGAVEPTIAGASFLDGDPDRLAKALNAAHGRAHSEKPVDVEASWRALSETMKESNRRAVRHAFNKLVDLGLQWRGMHDPGLPGIGSDDARRLLSVDRDLDCAAVLDGRASPSREEMLIAKLAETEHRRWLVDRALDGWRPANGAARDNGRRIHPSIVEFRKLMDGDEKFDAVLVRELLTDFSSARPSAVTARFARRRYLLIEETASNAPPICQPATELLLAWRNGKTHFASEELARLEDMLTAWARSPDATRLRIVLGAPLRSELPKGKAGRSCHAAMRQLIEAVRSKLDVSVTRLYGRDNACLPDEKMIAYLEAAIAANLDPG